MITIITALITVTISITNNNHDDNGIVNDNGINNVDDHGIDNGNDNSKSNSNGMGNSSSNNNSGCKGNGGHCGDVYGNNNNSK